MKNKYNLRKILKDSDVFYSIEDAVIPVLSDADADKINNITGSRKKIKFMANVINVAVFMLSLSLIADSKPASMSAPLFFGSIVGAGLIHRFVNDNNATARRYLKIAKIYVKYPQGKLVADAARTAAQMKDEILNKSRGSK